MIMVFFGLFSVNADAAVPYPRIKPPAPNLSEYLGDRDSKLFRAALKAADNKKWASVKAAQKQINDPVAKDVLAWIHAYRNKTSNFKDLSYVVQNLNDWPRMVPIQARAEDRLFNTPMAPSRTIDWFVTRDPVSGEGRVALAKAFFAQRDYASGQKWLELAWRESKLTREGQKKVFSQYKSRLTTTDHAMRADHLIWQGRGHFSKAQALLPHMNKGDRALMDARMRVSGNRNGMDAAINRVPKNLQNSPGLLYERARWRRRKKTKNYAMPVYLNLRSAPTSEKGKERVWKEKKLMAYWAIDEKRYRDAYQLSLNHGFTQGSGFAEAEFLAGWVSLVKLNKPAQALAHFERLKEGVTYPVSLSRANYWIARTHEATNNGMSMIYYADAARFSNTFYGFLAADKASMGPATVFLPNEANTDAVNSDFYGDRRVRAMHLLGEAREEHYFNLFAFHLDDVVETPQHLSLLSALGKEYGYMKPSVRAAKQAARFQSMLTESGYPLPEAITTLSNKFDKPFVLAIARQESEFNHLAVSSAKAYGLMQMINSTAKATARKHRIPYSRSRLASDINYNANLGALHLNDLLKQFDGSYIMAAAAYNAGPHRVRSWVKAYGDPRDSDLDPIDWMESIPFSETRNYVQRVMENMQVYEARLNGNTAQNKMQRYITQGSF